MLSEETDWQELKSSVTYVESDSLAVIRTDYNALSWLPVYLNKQSGEPFLRTEDQWIPLNEVRNFERYQKINRKKLFDTSTLEVVEL